MKFHSPIGCLECEKLHGNDMVVDFRCEYDISAAAASDRLEDTLDYSAVYEVIASQMSSEANLLEHVAGRIAGELKERFPELTHFTVKVSKKNPPVTGVAEWSSVTLEI